MSAIEFLCVVLAVVFVIWAIFLIVCECIQTKEKKKVYREQAKVSLKDLEYSKAFSIIKHHFAPYKVEELENGQVRIWLSDTRFVLMSILEYEELKRIWLENY